MTSPKYNDYYGMVSGKGDPETESAAQRLRQHLSTGIIDRVGEYPLSGMVHRSDGTWFWMRGKYGALLRVHVEREDD